jgi:phage terminase large subunit
MATNPTINRIEKAQFAYFETAKRFGVPSDQLRNFRNGGYVAQEKQLMYHAACRACDLPGGPTQVGFGGARGPGKSHSVFAQIALDDATRYEGLKILYLRKVAKNAKEQFEDLRRSVLKNTPHDLKKVSGTIFFPNGSRVLFGHFKNESDIDNYLGLEYDIIAIEEATSLTLSKYKTLRDSNRSSKEGFRPRIYASTNPGGVGHAWFKERFIKPAREGKETDTRFIFATVDDNAFIDEDYTKKLEDNTGWKLKAYRYGDWDIAAGQFFTTFRYDVHAKANLKAIPGATFWASLDYGFTHFTVSHLFMRYDGHTYCLDEFAARKQLVAENAAGIKAMLKRHGLTPENLSNFVAGHDCFASRGVSTGETVADEYQKAGIRLTRADVDRISGAARILQMLGDVDREKNPIAPTVSISTRCARLLECLPVLEHDPKRPEDVLKVDADDEGNGGDDPYDSFRYGVMTKTGGGIWL